MLKSRKKIIVAAMMVGVFMTTSINTSALVNVNGVNTNARHSAVYAKDKQDVTATVTSQKVDDKYKWNLEDIYPNVQAWEKDIEKLQKECFPKLKNYKGKLKDPKKLLEFFKLDDKTSSIIDKVYWYAGFKGDLDQGDTEATELKAKAESVYGEYGQIITFFTPEILAQNTASLKKLVSNPILKDYAHFIDVLIKQKEHSLSTPEEDILANAGEFANSPQEIFSKLKDADMKKPIIKDKDGKDIELTPVAISKILDGKDRDLRKTAYDSECNSLKQFENTFSSIYLSSVKKDIFLAKSRKYKTSLEASLSQESIPKEVYENLVGAVNKNMAPLHKYIELRRKVLNVDKVHGYDLAVPLVDNYELKIPYEEAKTMILDGLKPLGSEYLSIVKEGFDSRWLDVYESKGKTTGGYNLGLYGVHPFVLLNYDDTLDAMSTTAHEMGHAVNAVYAQKAQTYRNSNTPIFTAEVASTANELIMTKYLLKNAKNDDEKLYLLNQLVDNIKNTVYTQVLFSEFEKITHEKLEAGEPLSAKSLSKIYGDLQIKYNGNSFMQDEESSIRWARVPHFYTNFYVYKYATSMAASNQIVKTIIDGKDKNAVNNYLDFLKAGSSVYPVDALKKAGVDPTKSTSIDNLLTEFGQYVDQMETILKKQGKIK